MGVVFQDELFEEEERFLVADLLPDLDDGLPRLPGRRHVAVVAELVGHDVLDGKLLLQDKLGELLLLYLQLDLDPLGMGLGPDEVCVDEADLFEPPYLSQEQGHQLFALWLHKRPRGAQVPVAPLAVVNDQLFRYAFGDVDLGRKAGWAHVCRVRRDRGPAYAAQYHALRLPRGQRIPFVRDVHRVGGWSDDFIFLCQAIN